MDLEAESLALGEDIASVEMERTSLQQQLLSQADLHASLQEAIKAKETTVMELQRRQDELLEERRGLQLAQDAARMDRERDLARQEQALTDLNQERDDLAEQVSQLHQVVASVTEDLALETGKLERYEPQFQHLQQEVQRLQLECGKRDDENMLLQQRNSQLNDKCKENLRQLNEQRGKETSQQQNQDIAERRLSDEVASLRQQLSELQERGVTPESDREVELSETVRTLTVKNQQVQAALGEQDRCMVERFLV